MRMNVQDVLESDYIDVPVAARVLGVSGIRVRELCQDGRFRGAFKFGGTWIIPRAAVEGHERLPPGRRPRKSRDAALIDAFRAASGKEADEEGAVLETELLEQ